MDLKRDYKKEYKRDHSSAKAKKDRAARNKARKDSGLKKGDPREVDHKQPLSKGGSYDKSNTRIVSKKTNRQKGAKSIMPVPKPKKDEKEKDFISRCMGDSVMVKEYKDQKQRSGVCYSQWRNRKMSERLFVLPINLTEDDFIEHLFLYTGNFKHAMYGRFEVTLNDLNHVMKNFKDKIGCKLDEGGAPVLPINYNHTMYGGAEDSKNAGLIKGFSLKGEQLYCKIWLTDEARDRIKKKEFMWISPEFNEHYEDESGKECGFTGTGMGLTNIPFLKNKQYAIKLSEKGFEDFSDITKIDIDKLEKDCFAFEGKFPYKDATGEINIPLLLNSLDEIEKSNLSISDKSKAKAILIKAAKQVGVGDESEYDKILQGDQIMELEKQLREVMGLKEEDDIVESLKTLKESSDKIDKIEEIETQVKKLTEDNAELEKQNKELQDKIDSTDDKVVLTESEHKALVEGMKEGQSALKKLNDKEAEEVVETAIKEGKLHPKQRKSMTDLAKSNRKLFDETLAGMEEGSVNFDDKGSGEEGDTDASPRQELTDKIEKLAKEKKVTFTEASKLMREENPALFEE